MSNTIEYDDLIAFHPGSYVEDLIEDLNISQAEFANRLGTTPKTVSLVVRGKENISNDLANKLAKLSGVSVKTWLNLQAMYDEKVLEIENQQNEDLDTEIAKQIDIKALKDLKVIENKSHTVAEKNSKLRSLLHMASLNNLVTFNPMVSYRQADVNEKAVINANVMLELAMNYARNVTDTKFNKKTLEKLLPDIKQLIVEMPEDVFTQLKTLLLDAGIVLVGMPKFQGAKLNGATTKFRNGSVLLLITDLNKKEDIFWFSLLHELGHIYYGEFDSNLSDNEVYREKERKADKFSADFLIPLDRYQEFVNQNVFNEEAIVTFAQEVNTSPAIVVGRLQNDQLVGFNEFSHLKRSYAFNAE
ncbi:HigA family addiction module antitoxin [Weissella ceti]|uniref:HigA family addiction module antitoxin n=1 Tax=Weissella ceti TaxID=759620 RepID=A0ABT3E3J4_9LACO|nr:HigA family addiction module antitoxin [Weissella ceti]MCW0952979.1 HigA family addiction module antitoxin [Weissella ceti]QVK11523.1 HigA family addiction module antidote protein [Weissella ceti]